MKPCERGFAEIKRWLRANHRQAQNNPEAAIKQAFELYSVTGPFRHTGNKKCELNYMDY